LRIARLREAAERAGLEQVHLLPEPVAAVVHLGVSVPVGKHVAGLDFGGGTVDAAVLRRTSDGFVLDGLPGGLDPLGGEDFDQLTCH
jgi:molecular chaperone DnaK